MTEHWSIDIDDLISECTECPAGSEPGKLCSEGCHCLPCGADSIPRVIDRPEVLAQRLAEMALEYAKLVQNVKILSEHLDHTRHGAHLSPAAVNTRLRKALDGVKTIRMEAWL